LFISREVEALSGYSVEDFVNKKINYADIIHPMDQGRIEKVIQIALKRNDAFEVMYRITDKNGREKWVWERGKKETPGNRGLDDTIVGVISDITKHKQQIEQKLQQGETAYRHLYENVPIGLYRASEAGFFMSVNSAMHNMFGYAAKEDLLNTRIVDLYVNQSDRQKFLDVLQIKGYLAGHELFLRKKDGATFWGAISAQKIAGDSGNTFYYDGYVQDITAQKNAEATLRESEERYRILSENITDGVALVDEGKILFTNSAFQQILGFTPDDKIEGMSVFEFIVEKDQAGLLQFEQDLKAGLASVNTLQLRCRTKDDRDIWIESHNNVVSWQGEPKILVTFRDITARKKQEQDLQQEKEYLRQENLRLRSTAKDRYRFGDIIGKSEAMQAVYDLIMQTAANEANVIIYGESGTGKELTARGIHQLSRRGDKPFVVVNCGAIPESLIESEFFGYKKGAFTGAVADKLGYLDVADGGTLFLDEVGDIPLSMQVKLLRVLEGGGMSPLGSATPVHPDLRIIAATNKNLKKLVRSGDMRQDFFYRLHIIPIYLPPLRKRKGDLSLLVENFMEKDGENYANSPSMTPAIMQRLLNYSWPGNVRELKNVIQRFLAMQKLDLPDDLNQDKLLIDELTDTGGGVQNLSDLVKQFENQYIKKVLESTQWHRGKAAALLGIDRKTLSRKLNRN
jgi:PAS domain S-box-containing protein